MPEPQAHAANARVDGWTRYYEYFHKLNENIQRTAELAAQRRSRLEDPSMPALKPTPRTTDHSCFESIAESIRRYDKPLVIIEDDEDYPEKSASANPDKPAQVLRDADLRLVRAQLRTAAHASNLRAAVAREAEQREMSELASITNGCKKEAAVPLSAAGAAVDSTASRAAAMETLVYFGLALGEQQPGGGGKGQKGGGKEGANAAGKEGLELEQMTKCFDEYERSLDAPAGDEVVGSLGGWDWMQAMSDSGLREGGDGLKSGLTEQAAMGHLERFESDAPSETASSERDAWDAAWEAASEGSSDGAEGSEPAGLGLMLTDGGEEQAQAQMQDAEATVREVAAVKVDSRADDDGPSAASPYVSPLRESFRSRAGRQSKPKRSLLEAMEAPLLKWEKERQKKKPTQPQTERPTRNERASRESSRGSGVGSASREGLYDTDTGDAHVEDDALLGQLGPLCAFAMSSDELGAELVTTSDAKRPRV